MVSGGHLAPFPGADTRPPRRAGRAVGASGVEAGRRGPRVEDGWPGREALLTSLDGRRALAGWTSWPIGPGTPYPATTPGTDWIFLVIPRDFAAGFLIVSFGVGGRRYRAPATMSGRIVLARSPARITTKAHLVLPGKALHDIHQESPRQPNGSEQCGRNRCDLSIRGHPKVKPP